jgi:fumarate hydratase, class I
VLDAAWRAQGEGCAPGFLGVAIGGDRGSSYVASKEALLRKVDEQNADSELGQLEQQLTEEANQLGIGPMGFGGQSTVWAPRSPPPTACRHPSSSPSRICAGPTGAAR